MFTHYHCWVQKILFLELNAQYILQNIEYKKVDYFLLIMIIGKFQFKSNLKIRKKIKI